MGVEGGARHERDEVAPILGVDEEDALPRRQGPGHGRQASAGGGRCLGVAHRDEHLLARRERHGRHGTVRSFSARRRKKVAPARANQYQLPASPRRTPARKKRRRRRSTSEPPDLDDRGAGRPRRRPARKANAMTRMPTAPTMARPRGRGGPRRRLALAHDLRVGGLQVLTCDEPSVAPGPRGGSGHQLAPSCASCSSAWRRATTSGSLACPGPAVIRQTATPITASPSTKTAA